MSVPDRDCHVTLLPCDLGHMLLCLSNCQDNQLFDKRAPVKYITSVYISQSEPAVATTGPRRVMQLAVNNQKHKGMSQNKTKRICVVGAGPSGLTSIRQLVDEGLDVVCFEKSDRLGGLWCYREEVVQGLPSVARSTIINTSKEYSAFSDFPPPETFPNFMHNKCMLKFMQMYAKANDIHKFIHYHQEVAKIDFADGHEANAQWNVFVRNTVTGEYSLDVFDGVMIATGHHSIPRMVHFPGQERFRGQILHTHAFKHAIPFQGKSVCVIGAGNSAIDAIVELSSCASRVFMSTRRGVWIRPRVAHRGWPTDSWLTTRAVTYTMGMLPSAWANSILECLVNSRMDHAAYGLKPQHRILQQHPVTNDALPNCILSGRVAVRGNVSHFTETGVVFEGETDVTEVDVVIFGTGYKKEISFIDPEIICPSCTDQAGGLFKYMFSADIPHPRSIALIGIVHPLGPVHTVSELQARWFAGLMSGRLRLPDRDVMRKHIAKDKEFHGKAYYESPKHTLQIVYIPYMNEIADIVGCKPKLWKYLVSDPKLWYHLVFGLYSVYQFRLEGPHTWPHARDTIINTNKRILAPLTSKVCYE